LLLEVFKGGQYISFEEVHRNEDSSIQYIQFEFTDALGILIRSQKRSGELANIRNKRIDKRMLEVRVVLTKDCGNLIGKVIVFAVCIIQVGEKTIAEGLVDEAIGIEGVG
jgi:hypothetical protein